MAEASNVRLVRCPKCENLLPELPDFSVYQCGGCGAVLRANKRVPVNDGLPKKSDDEGGCRDFEKGAVNLGSVSETERESDGVELDRTKDRVFRERTVKLADISSSRTDNREYLVDSERIRKGETIALRSDQSKKVEFYGDEYRGSSKISIDNEPEETKPPIGSLRSWPSVDQWNMERKERIAFRGNARGVAEQRRFATSSYLDEGPSNYHMDSFYGYKGQIRTRDEVDGLPGIENLENDRAELLRKLDELKDQLSRSFDVAEKPKERVAVDRRMAPPPPDPYGRLDPFMPGASSSLYSINRQPLHRDKHVLNPPYFNYNHAPIPNVNGHDLDMQDFYRQPRNVPNELLGYEDAYRQKILSRPSHQPPQKYLQRPYYDHIPEHYMDSNQDPFVLHPHETFFHQPACSCLRCYNKNWPIPPKVLSPAFRSWSPHDPTNSIFHHYVNPATYGPQGYNTKGLNPTRLHAWDQQPHTRSSNDLDSDGGGFGYRCPRRVLVAHGGGRVYHPIAGGAPFITCCNCFELLKLPRKLMVAGKDQRKMRCGACSAVILFEFENKGFVVLVSTQTKQVSAEVYDGSGEMLDENLSSSHGCSNPGAMNSCSDDHNNSGYNFHLADTEPNLLARDQRSNLSESEKRQDSHSSSSSFSEDEQSPESVIFHRDVSSCAELPSKDDASLPIPDSPLLEHLNYSSQNALSRYGKGNKSRRTHDEKVIHDQTTSRQNSLKDAPAATEMEVPFHEYLNSGISQDSVDVNKEEDRDRINKGGESFFAGLIKRSFKDLSRSSQSVENGRSNVFVNGQLVPDCVVKKAEKLAGPIQPGEYWYDFRAGFWGVMGQPCLGIIPPFIEEFNYPMPENCAGGNTGVFVNGRELHQKDLDLLADRGLPIARDKSYLIEISGRVWDEDTGEELDSLGKLAPTVERVKHGFGMKVPRVVA